MHWPFGVMEWHRSHDHCSHHVGFYVDGPLRPSIYLASLWRYGASLIFGSQINCWLFYYKRPGQNVIHCGAWYLTSNYLQLVVYFYLVQTSECWLSEVTVGGHFGSVQDIVWGGNGEFLLSVSSDQTTRLHAVWASADDKSEVSQM